MAIKIALKNPKTSEVRQVKVGWSWVLFLFSGFFGIPLFRRHLATWGRLFLSFNVAYFLTAWSHGALANFIFFVVFVAQWALLFLLGFKGNEVTAKTWLSEGWQFVDPNTDATKFAKLQWRISDRAPDLPSTTEQAAPT
jgi:hypothetical protein